MSQTTELIRRLIAMGLPQIEISRRTGIPQPRLSRWQSGEAPDAADDALTLARLEAEMAATKAVTECAPATPAAAESLAGGVEVAP